MRLAYKPDMGSRKGKENLKEKEKFAIIKLAEANVKQSAIAKQFKLSRSAVCKLLGKKKRDYSLSWTLQLFVSYNVLF